MPITVDEREYIEMIAERAAQKAVAALEDRYIRHDDLKHLHAKLHEEATQKGAATVNTITTVAKNILWWFSMVAAGGVLVYSFIQSGKVVIK